MPKPRILTIAATIAWLATSPAVAGPLNPPGGPVLSTAKPIAEVEPRTAINAANTPGDDDASPSLFKITQPGSYYLTGNITGVAGRHGIEIAASGVTLDLNGFRLEGVTGSLDGIVCLSSFGQISIRNGSIGRWGGNGLALDSFGASGAVTSISSSNNGGVGIRTGVSFTVENCAARSNGGDGIDAGIYSTLLNCSAAFNTGIGIIANSNSTVLNCAASGSGETGFSSGAGCTYSNCSAIGNDGFGFSTAQGCTLTGCSAWNNFGGGYSVGSGCTVTSCTANTNNGIGIATGSASSVTRCTVASSDLDGIFVSSDCVVRDNTVDNAGLGVTSGAAIHSTGSDNRIEGNNCTDSDRGIEVDSSGNIILRNTCAGNTTNWDIVANNVLGPILDRTAPASLPVLGNSAPSSLGSTDPNANFTY